MARRHLLVCLLHLFIWILNAISFEEKLSCSFAPERGKKKPDFNQMNGCVNIIQGIFHNNFEKKWSLGSPFMAYECKQANYLFQIVKSRWKRKTEKKRWKTFSIYAKCCIGCFCLFSQSVRRRTSIVLFKSQLTCGLTVFV